MNKKKLIRWFFLGIHLCLASSFFIGALVEFARPPPFFDSYITVPPLTPSKDEVFAAISTVVTAGNAEIHRLMDFPILFIVTIYFGAVVYLRFGVLAWRLTGVAGTLFLIYFIINVWAADYFDWRHHDTDIVLVIKINTIATVTNPVNGSKPTQYCRYFGPRAEGILIQVMCFAFMATVTVTTVMWKRRRLTFKLKSPFNLPNGGKAHVLWNIIGTFLLFFLCLLIWVGRGYQSYVCVQTRSEIGFLCQMTSQVSCIPCNECTKAALKNCSSAKATYCFSGVAFGKGFCVFNYSVGYFTFTKLFAYTGGLYFFLRNFLNASSHYVLLIAYSMIQWWRGHEEQFEATWSSLRTRFSFSDRVDLRAYFRSRFRQHRYASRADTEEGSQSERAGLIKEEDESSDFSPERDKQQDELVEVT